MKKIIATYIIISCAWNLLAQDIIALKNGERIEDVQILSVDNKEVTYSTQGKTVTLPHNSVQAILYADGRYEELKATFVSDSASVAAAEQLGYNAEELQTIVDQGEDRKMLLWQDKTYPAACRKAGKKVYFKVFQEYYAPAFKEAKKSGMKNQEAMQQAIEKAFIPAAKASNEAVRECNGGM